MTASAATDLARLSATLTARSAIHAEDVLAMRRIVWGDGAVSTAEAEAIMALNTACHVRSREWIDYFVEVMVDYIVHQQQPTGYVDEAKAGWLMQWIDRDGRVDSLSELELLIKVLEVASAVPESLRAYVLRQIEAAVLTGSGPTRQGSLNKDGALDPAGINATEVELLRRALYAMSGEEGYVVSQAEADLLFRLKAVTLNGKNADAWPDLFVKCVGNHLMGHAQYRFMTRDEQAGFDAYVADTHVDLGRFFKRIFTGGTDERLSGRLMTTEQNNEAAMAKDRAITPVENVWLTQQIKADGVTDALETAVLDLIKRESGAA